MILVKTDTGQQVFKDRSVRLTPRQRSAFILFDGRRSVGEILASCEGIAQDDIEQMIELGLLGPEGAPLLAPSAPAQRAAPATVAVVEAAPRKIEFEPALDAAPGVRSSQQRYKDAYPVATQLTGNLGLRGFRLNLAVEGTTSYEELLALAPKIRASVGPEKAAVLDRALGI
ncbi:hypothetical protein [Variovorax sp. ZT4R33]|uniref:hypothetical protein n=1 Tax=Variovorax sp. ZT4R33 TaxID=3443743 RepID=UPI003F480A84